MLEEGGTVTLKVWQLFSGIPEELTAWNLCSLFFSRDSHSSYGARGDLRRHAGSCPPHPYAKVMGVLLNTVFSGLGGSRFVIFCILKSVLCILPLHQKLKPQRKDATSSLQGSHCSISRAFELEAPLPTPQSTAATQVCPFHFS